MLVHIAFDKIRNRKKTQPSVQRLLTSYTIHIQDSIYILYDHI